MSDSRLYKRMRPSYYALPPNKRTKYFNLQRPGSYKRSQEWNDFRTLKYIASRPLAPNLRTGGFVGKERKFVDYNHSSTIVTNIWSLKQPPSGSFNAVAQGSGESERIGRKITNSSLHINGTLSLIANCAKGVTVRLIVFKDTQANGASPVASSVVNSTVNGFRNLEFVSRYQVLADKTYVLNPSITYNGGSGNAFVGSETIRHFSFNFRLSGTTSFDDNNASITDIVDNSYQLLAVADDPGSVNILYNSRFRFYG